MRLRIVRHEGAVETSLDEYEVPDSPGLTALDAVAWVREHHDPSIAVRFSCRSANACKECLAMVNGERTYLCTAPAVGTVTVAPLPRHVVRDLATGKTD